jgi:anti-anti-sigma factor
VSSNPGGAGNDGLVTVRLVALPVQVHLRAQAHQEALQREFEVLRRSEDVGSVPDRLLNLVGQLEHRYGAFAEMPQAALQDAVGRGATTVDLEFPVPPDTPAACVELAALLDEVDDYCRQGEHLLTLQTPPESLGYRRWFLGEFIAQVGGAAPVPWPEFLDAGPRPPDAGAGAGADASAGAGAAAGDTEAGAEGAGSAARVHPAPAHGLPAGWAIESRGDQVTVRPAGELDLQTAPEVRDLVQAARGEGTSQVVLDLGAVTFIDSVGLSMIVAAHQRLDEDGVAMQVVVPPMLQRLFDISGLDQLLDVSH